MVMAGATGDIPAPGDYEGDGKADYGAPVPSSNSAATRPAVVKAQRPVLSSPRTRLPTPSPRAPGCTRRPSTPDRTASHVGPDAGADRAYRRDQPVVRFLRGSGLRQPGSGYRLTFVDMLRAGMST
jgi:hypothetical protein